MSSCCVLGARYFAHDWFFYLQVSPPFCLWGLREPENFSHFPKNPGEDGSCVWFPDHFFFPTTLYIWNEWIISSVFLSFRTGRRTEWADVSHSVKAASLVEGCPSSGRMPILGNQNGRSLCCVWLCPTKTGFFLWVFAITSSRAQWE